MSRTSYSVNAMIADRWHRNHLQHLDDIEHSIRREEGNCKCLECKNINLIRSIASKQLDKNTEAQMKLHEDPKVIKALNCILEEYPGRLEYDEELTKLTEKNTETTDSDNNILHIKILDSRIKRSDTMKKRVADKICSKLKMATGRNCYCSNLTQKTPYLIIKEKL